MSSAPKGRGKGPGGPKPEKKAVAAPVITPQVLGIICAILLLVGVIAYWQMVVNKFSQEKAALEGKRNQIQSQIQTYELKQSKRDTARNVNETLREKLNTLDYLFLVNQESMVPFWEDTFLPILYGSNLSPGEDSIIDADEYLFKVNMAMKPFKTLPGSTFFDDAAGRFPIQYIPESGGVPTEEPLDTKPPAFLHPYNITLENWYGTYEDVKSFVTELQRGKQDVLITVHCLVNDDSKNAGIYRTETAWTIKLTVYFMNPEQPASGDNPPAPPGANRC